MTVGVGMMASSALPSDQDLAGYEQERPARRLRPALDPVISVWCAILSVGALLQVFAPLPQGTQFYLVIFLAAILPIRGVCVHPLFDFDGYLERRQVPTVLDTVGSGARLLPITDLLPKMREKYGSIYTQASTPAVTYKQASDVPTTIVPTVLLVRKDMKDDLAEQLTKVVYDNKDALMAVNAAARGITLENADKTDPVPLHPGAKKAADGLR